MRLTAKQIPESKGLQGDLSVNGKIIRVFDKKSGTGKSKETGADVNWSFQGLIIQDETGEMNISLKNRPEELKKEDVGRSITITSSKTSKGIFGVKVEEESYTDSQQKQHTAIKVIVTPSAGIKFGDATAHEETPKKEPSETQEPEIKVELADLDKIRKDTIKITIDAYFEALKDKVDLSVLDIQVAVIAAAGRNADTFFIAKNGR